MELQNRSYVNNHLTKCAADGKRRRGLILTLAEIQMNTSNQKKPVKAKVSAMILKVAEGFLGEKKGTVLFIDCPPQADNMVQKIYIQTLGAFFAPSTISEIAS